MSRIKHKIIMLPINNNNKKKKKLMSKEHMGLTVSEE